jgi:dihydrodipicolinate synthase/N-acetylneuraminate lyase
MASPRKIANKIAKNLVVPIPAMYDNYGGINKLSIFHYLKFLKDRGVNCVMTTAGTSQFNMLAKREIAKLNYAVSAEGFSSYVLGIPPTNTVITIEQIKSLQKMIGKKTNKCVMLLYPERYYDDETIVGHFYRCADSSEIPVIIHAMFMRQGNGGWYDYSPELINKLVEHPNIVGIKEETSELGKAYNTCSKINTDDCVVIAAGGSMRRFNALKPTGIQTWLSGVGNMFPEAELAFRKDTSKINIIKDFENPMFDVFMKIGWHKAMREAIRQLTVGCIINGKPFAKVADEETKAIKNVLEELKEQCRKHGF